MSVYVLWSVRLMRAAIRELRPAVGWKVRYTKQKTDLYNRSVFRIFSVLHAVASKENYTTI